MILKNTSHKILWQFSIELDLVNKARRLTKARIIARFLSLLLEILGFCKGKKKKKVKKKKKSCNLTGRLRRILELKGSIMS